MKKIIAAALCLTIASPCMAAGRFHEYYPEPAGNRAPQPHYEQRYDYHNDFHRPRECRRASTTTRTLAAVAGVAGVAAIVSAIID